MNRAIARSAQDPVLARFRENTEGFRREVRLAGACRGPAARVVRGGVEKGCPARQNVSVLRIRTLPESGRQFPRCTRRCRRRR